MASWYEVLGVDRSAAPEVIRAAYRAQVRSKHPDVGGDVDAFRQLVSAYEVLSDPSARAAYDRTLAGSGTRSGPPPASPAQPPFTPARSSAPADYSPSAPARAGSSVKDRFRRPGSSSRMAGDASGAPESKVARPFVNVAAADMLSGRVATGWLWADWLVVALLPVLLLARWSMRSRVRALVGAWMLSLMSLALCWPVSLAACPQTDCGPWPGTGLVADGVVTGQGVVFMIAAAMLPAVWLALRMFSAWPPHWAEGFVVALVWLFAASMMPQWTRSIGVGLSVLFVFVFLPLIVASLGVLAAPRKPTASL